MTALNVNLLRTKMLILQIFLGHAQPNFGNLAHDALLSDLFTDGGKLFIPSAVS